MDWWGQGSTAAHIVNTLLGQSNWVIVTCYDVMLAHMIDHVSSRRGIFHRVRVVEYLLHQLMVELPDKRTHVNKVI